MSGAERIVVVGGTGQIGSKAVHRLSARGHDVRVASRGVGVDLLSGRGLAEVLAGASVVIDVSKPSTYDASDLHAFFHTAIANLLAAESAHGVRHHVMLSIVGSDRPHGIPFYEAKAASEQIVRDSGIPFSIVHATQFFEFAPGIAESADAGDVVTLPEALVQPAAGDDVAAAIVDVALGPPSGSDAETAGPEQMPLADFVTRVLRSRGDRRVVRASPDGRYFGGRLARDTLLPGHGARILPTTLGEWLLSESDANLGP